MDALARSGSAPGTSILFRRLRIYDVAVAGIGIVAAGRVSEPVRPGEDSGLFRGTPSFYKGSTGQDCKSTLIDSPTERSWADPGPEIRQWKGCQYPRRISFYCRISEKGAFLKDIDRAI